ncbi:MAG: glycoside hydrolase family 57 protein [Planctomycetota bacterium]
MIDVVFYFQVHQPFRLRRFAPSSRIERADWFDEPLDRLVMERVSERCYLPMTALLSDVIERTDGRFRCAFSLSGTAIRQMKAWAPKALRSFERLAASGCAEFLCETSRHSLSAVADPDEFREQVMEQRKTIADLFGEPGSFRNTELILDNRICSIVESMGFECILGEGADRLLGWRSPQVPYRPKGCRKLKLLLRSYSLSDDIAFRFSNRRWPAWPLFADTYAGWLRSLPEPAQFVGLFMDFETFGEHQPESTGIFEFMRRLPEEVLATPGLRFRTPAEVAATRESVAELDIPSPVSWADAERNLTAWLGNPMQQAAHRALYELRPRVMELEDERPDLLHAWRDLSTSDHFYYMATKSHSDGEVHDYFSPHDSPHAAFVSFMTVLDHLRSLVQRAERMQGIEKP